MLRSIVPKRGVSTKNNVTETFLQYIYDNYTTVLCRCDSGNIIYFVSAFHFITKPMSIFTRNIAELHEMLQELNQASLEVGLSMNFKKTNIMCNKHAEDTNRKITIDSNEIEEIDHYIYLGQRISMETASKEQEIKRRITLGWQAFGRASAIFKNKEIPTCLKRQVYNQCIIPTVTYGSETWNLTKIQTMKLRSMQRAHERIMLNITWRDHKTAERIREQTKLRDILETTSKAKWTWAGQP